jgi:hypothetical protein
MMRKNLKKLMLTYTTYSPTLSRLLGVMISRDALLRQFSLTMSYIEHALYWLRKTIVKQKFCISQKQNFRNSFENIILFLFPFLPKKFAFWFPKFSSEFSFYLCFFCELKKIPLHFYLHSVLIILAIIIQGLIEGSLRSFPGLGWALS